MIYLIGLPGASAEELFKDFGITSDYRITISLVPKLSEKEYEMISNLREQILTERLKERDPHSKASYISGERDLIMQLPQYYSDRHSISLYSSYAVVWEFQPADVAQTLKSVREILDKTYQKYDQLAK